MTTYVSPYTGQTISPSQVGFENLSIAANTYLEWPINGNTTNVVANILDVTASVDGLELYMPPATQVSVGQTTLIRNIGSHDFNVVDISGNTIVVVVASTAQYVYVVDNTSINGTWQSLQFGAGTSTANAAALAGYGLKAVGTTLNTVAPPFTVGSDYTILPAAQSQTVVWTGGAGTLTLPSASSVALGWYVVIKNDGTGTLNVTPVGTDSIDGDSYFQLQPAESFTLVSNLSFWVSYGYGQSNLFVFTELVLNISSGVVTLTASQAANLVQQYQGSLTGNVTVILPPVVQFYAISNNTTGAFTLTFSTGVSGGSVIVLGQGQTIIAICDGTNIYNAQTSTSSSFTAITIGKGSAAAPSLNFVGNINSGLYQPTSNSLGVALNGVNVATFTETGLLVPIGIQGGSI
jgi:hypothetical protein